MKDINWLKEEFKKLETTRINLDDIGMSVLNKVFVNKDDVMNLIDQVEQPEILSQEWIDEHAEYHEYIGFKGVPTEYLINLLVPNTEDLIELSELAMGIENLTGMTLEEIWDGARNGAVFVEPKYYVLDKKNMVPMLLQYRGKVERVSTHLRIDEPARDRKQFQLTEKEIKDYDERYLAFAVPVEEVKE